MSQSFSWNNVKIIVDVTFDAILAYSIRKMGALREKEAAPPNLDQNFKKKSRGV